MGDKVGEILASSSGSKGCGQLYKVQLAAGYLLPAWGIDTGANTLFYLLTTWATGQRCTLRKFKLGRVVGRLEDRAGIQTNFNRLYKYAIRNPMKTSTKENSLNWESKKPRNQYVQETNQLQLYNFTSFTEEDLGFLVDNTLNVPVAKAACGNLGCSSKGVTRKLRQVFPFFSAHPFWGVMQSFGLPSPRKPLVGWSPSVSEPPEWPEGQHHEGRGDNWAGSAWRKDRDIAAVFKDLSGAIEIVEPDSFEWGTGVGEEAMDAGRYKGILMRNKKSYLSMGWSDTETGSQRGCEIVILGDIQNSTRPWAT